MPKQWSLFGLRNFNVRPPSALFLVVKHLLGSNFCYETIIGVDTTPQRVIKYKFDNVVNVWSPQVSCRAIARKHVVDDSIYKVWEGERNGISPGEMLVRTRHIELYNQFKWNCFREVSAWGLGERTYDRGSHFSLQCEAGVVDSSVAMSTHWTTNCRRTTFKEPWALQRSWATVHNALEVLAP